MDPKNRATRAASRRRSGFIVGYGSSGIVLSILADVCLLVGFVFLSNTENKGQNEDETLIENIVGYVSSGIVVTVLADICLYFELFFFSSILNIKDRTKMRH